MLTCSSLRTYISSNMCICESQGGRIWVAYFVGLLYFCEPLCCSLYVLMILVWMVQECESSEGSLTNRDLIVASWGAESKVISPLFRPE